MPTELDRIVRIAVTAIVLATLALPVFETGAASDLYPGAPAVVSSRVAPFASLKSAPDSAAVEVIQIDNGISATIVAGPLPGAGGLLWYQVEVAGMSGYIAEIDLTWGTSDAAGSAPAETPPLPAITGNGVVLSADGTEIACRTEPSEQAEWVFSYASGSTVDLAGVPANGWQPVICAAQLGYVPAPQVYDPALLPTPAPTEIVVSPVVTDVTETVVATEIIVTPEATEAIPEIVDTVVVSDDPATPAIPYATETIVIEQTSTPAPETTATGEPPATTEVGESATLSATETIVAMETTTPVTGQTVPTVTGTAESAGQTVAANGDLVVSASLATSAVVFNTGAGGLRCRGGASLESPVLMVLPPGTSLSLTGLASNGWQPVMCAGQNGFVAARFLQSSGEEPVPSDLPVDAAAALTGATGVIQNTEGVGLRCRSGASFTSSVITVLPEGAKVTSRGAAIGVWQPVTCAGQPGYVHTDFLGNTSGTGSGSSGGSTGSTTGSATVSGTNGDGVRFRASAGYDGAVITVLMEGTTVGLRNGSAGSWTAVSYGGSNGFIYSDFLTTARNPSPGTGSGVGSTSLSPGSNAQVTDALNFRSEPSYSAGVIGVAAIGTVVRVTGASSSGFYPVQWGGTAGYMYGDYLTYTTAALSSTGPNSGTGGSTGGGAGAGSGVGSASGQAMVDYAMRYLGYPYIWATHGPNSFDCSGFTYWVVLNVLGRDIGAGTWTQWGTGAPIQYGNLQPGDLVFFQNTYTVGLSHVGMYIGNDQFIHAENENTGVRISSLSSQYYSTRYLGARRLK